jgi:hypothetical protein
MLASNPEANSAHMVANMGSLASTVMFVTGAVSRCGRAAGGGGGGADLTFCAWLNGAAERNKNKPAVMARPGFTSKVRARHWESLSRSLAVSRLAFFLLRCIHFQSNVGSPIRQGSPGSVAAQFPVTWVDSIGRRNTRSTPTCTKLKGPKSFNPNQNTALSRFASTVTGSTVEVLSDQMIRKCCVDPLNRHN